ncbi:MAG: hypothetical protein Q9186_003181 [Xanthomendoza sp. 1 TL-2023]
MAPKTRVIIDTDPGTDDVLALLYALASSLEDIEVLLLSITFGNIDVLNCLRNAVSMFHVIEKEMRWRKDNGRPEGFDALKKSKPIIAVGADKPLGGERMEAAYFHGADGLGDVHASHPHHSSPSETWQHLFDRPPPDTILSAVAIEKTDDTSTSSPLFTPSSSASYLEILRILDQEPPDTITLIAIGPLTTLATAAAHAPKVFMKAKSLIVMGGAVAVPGNMTPVAEFNTIADAVAAARLYALTSPQPESTMPPPFDSSSATAVPDYPPAHQLGDRRLKIIKFPLDITTRQSLRREQVDEHITPLADRGSPLAEWVLAFTDHSFRRTEVLHQGHEVRDGGTEIALHDPVCVWYAINGEKQKDAWALVTGEDIRIETVGQWTRGMCVVDGRDRKKAVEGEEVVGDRGDWLDSSKGNRVDRCVGTPGEGVLAKVLLETVFGESK